MKYFCNPLNLPYKYQLNSTDGKIIASREAADPSLVYYQGLYYLFPSMTAGFYTSSDMGDWEFHAFKEDMPIYDYAPDVRVIDDYLYFCASKRDKNCPYYRSQNPIQNGFEEIKGTFSFWDPHLFQDDDGKIYFYWGCSNNTPLYGVEVSPETMIPIGEAVGLISSRVEELGFERNGEDHVPAKTPEMIAASVKNMLSNFPGVTDIDQLPKAMQETLLAYAGNAPYIEGAWVTKYKGSYYLQYAFPGTQYNVYGDGVYVAEQPLGPFRLAKNNPFSYKPGGFITGAGHGSTIQDHRDEWWHISTMKISKNHPFERRLGLWKAGFDDDGELYCDQRFGDWPIGLEQEPWEKPEWFLLSYGKSVRASSGRKSEAVVDEDVCTWWSAESNQAGEWIEINLGESYDVHAIQVNFADDQLHLPLPEGAELHGETGSKRYIDQTHQRTCWKLEGSLDGDTYFTIEDKTNALTDLPHDLIVRENGFGCRYVKLTVNALPYQQNAHVSGLRVFGSGAGNKPEPATEIKVIKESDLDLVVSWGGNDATGVNILWGNAPEKLYHSYMVFGKTKQKIGALIKGEPVYLRIDTFNESGITEGQIIKVDGNETV